MEIIMAVVIVLAMFISYILGHTACKNNYKATVKENYNTMIAYKSLVRCELIEIKKELLEIKKITTNEKQTISKL